MEWEEISQAERSGTLEIVPKRKLGHDTIVVLSDIHFPFHDELVLSQVERFIADAKPDHIILNGDIVDFYGLSKFDKDPQRKETLQDELDLAIAFFKRLREHHAPNAKISFIPGNHEARLERTLWASRNAKDLTSLRCLKLSALLALDRFEIDLIDPIGMMINDVLFTHGKVVKAHAAASAQAECMIHGCSGCSGHTHRAARFEVRKSAGEFVWIENGCLCDLNPHYVAGVANWQQAFSVWRISRSSHRFDAELVRIPDRKLIYRGKPYFNHG